MRSDGYTDIIVTAQRREERLVDVPASIVAISGEQLTRAGVKCLILEAGRDYDPLKETAMFQTAAEAPLRGASTPDKHFGYFDATANGGWQVPGVDPPWPTWLSVDGVTSYTPAQAIACAGPGRVSSCTAPTGKGSVATPAITMRIASRASWGDASGVKVSPASPRNVIMNSAAGSRGTGQTSWSRRATRARSARPRWEIACFSSALISAKVRPSPSWGTKTGSYPNPPLPAGVAAMRPSTSPRTTRSRPSGPITGGDARGGAPWR